MSESRPLLADPESGAGVQVRFAPTGPDSYGSCTFTTPVEKTKDGVRFTKSVSFEEALGTNTATLSWRDLSVQVPQLHQPRKGWFSRKKEPAQESFKAAVRSVSGFAKPGEVLAILGSSGAGKTTLLRVLGQRSPRELKITGEIRVNGENIGGPLDTTMAYISGFLYQDDLFMGSLTVREHLTFMARLRLPYSTTSGERDFRVDSVMQQLGLKKCENTPIGIPGKLKGLSGGEKKRLSFATEIFTDPPILFCDEPTSGLDSWNAERVVKSMKYLARGMTYSGDAKGRASASPKTIICSIHQPSSTLLSYFDRIMLMAEGRVAFHGTAEDALKFFASVGSPCPPRFNPADHFVNSLSIKKESIAGSLQNIERICNAFDASSGGQARMDEINRLCTSASKEVDGADRLHRLKRKAPPFWWELWALLVRASKDAKRNPIITKTRLFQRVIMVLLVSVIFSQIGTDQMGVQALTGIMFLVIMQNTFPNMNAVLNLYPRQIPLFLREFRSDLYSVHSYYVSKALFLIPGFILEACLYASLLYVIADLRPGILYYLSTLLALVLISNAAAAFGAMISSPFQNVAIPISLSTPMTTILLNLGGFFFNLSSWPPYIRWVQYLSWFRVGFESLMITQFGGNRTFSCGSSLAPNATAGDGCLRTGHDVLLKYTFDEANYTFDIVVMVGLFFAFHFIGYLLLLQKAYRS